MEMEREFLLLSAHAVETKMKEGTSLGKTGKRVGSGRAQNPGKSRKEIGWGKGTSPGKYRKETG